MATKIHDVTELQAISGNLTGNYELANDIDASGVSFIPLGTFTGSLDGKNYDINNLTITLNGAGTQWGALIKTNQGTIKNLRIENCQINVTAINPIARGLAAGIVISNDEAGVISNCHVTGTIALTVTASTSGYAPEAAGFVVWNNGDITKCHSTASVTIVGNPSPSIWGAGLVTDNMGTISESFAIGNVIITASAGTNETFAAGFVAWNDATWTTGTITDCYAKGNATGIGGDVGNYAAGFIQENAGGGILTNCYSIGIPTGASGIGGFCQVNTDGTITNCFWDTQTSGTAVSDGGTGKTTSQMKARSTFTSAGWDFIVIWGINGITNNGYPFHWAMPPEPPPDAPRRTVSVEDKITLETIRNVEMAAMGRFRVGEDGKAIYRSRYARNP